MKNEKRLIDANWILGEIEHDLGCYEIGKMTEDSALYVELRDIIKMVCAAPTVDAVEVVHGRWKQNGNFLMCSECYDLYKEREATVFCYCPNCGADMRERKAK